jgi:AmiR/NasT family two-component response regulator
MAGRGMGNHDAMLHLMAKAHDENRTLPEVAEKIIESTPGLDHDQG